MKEPYSHQSYSRRRSLSSSSDTLSNHNPNHRNKYNEQYRTRRSPPYERKDGDKYHDRKHRHSHHSRPHQPQDRRVHGTARDRSLSDSDMERSSKSRHRRRSNGHDRDRSKDSREHEQRSRRYRSRSKSPRDGHRDLGRQSHLYNRRRDRSPYRHRRRSRRSDSLSSPSRSRSRSPTSTHNYSHPHSHTLSNTHSHHKKRRKASSSRSPSPHHPPPPPPPAVRSRRPLPSQAESYKGTADVAVATKDNDKEKQKPNYNTTGLLARETNAVSGTDIVLKYNEPPDARKPPSSKDWRLYIFKHSALLQTITLRTRTCWLIGRELAVADIPVEHPSCSKQHAVIQFRHRATVNEFGDKDAKVRPYLIDLESSNGTLLNEEKVEASRYFELRNGDVVKFGFSEREFVVMLPPKDL